MNSKSLGIPNFFYDLIVFVSPSILLLFGFTIGYSGWSFNMIKTLLPKFGALDMVLIILALLFIAYEYGRLAEAISHTAVTQIIKLFKKLKLFKSEDYSVDFTSAVESLDLPIEIEESKKGNKWTIYFYALLYSPNIGQDLLKRYAWEKLSRSSAFTFLILFIVSVFYHLYFLFVEKCDLTGKYGFGSWYFTLFSLLLVYVTYVEFYRRKCWNNDLLLKVLPILISAKKNAESNQPKIEIKT